MRASLPVSKMFRQVCSCSLLFEQRGYSYEVGGFGDGSPIPRLKFMEVLLAMFILNNGVVTERQRIKNLGRTVAK